MTASNLAMVQQVDPTDRDPNLVAATTPNQRPDPRTKGTLEALYGTACPLLSETPTDSDWVTWLNERWDFHSPTMRPMLYARHRNRMMRAGQQWLSATGNGPYREPQAPRDAVRIVENCIGPALDQRLQIVCNQRPGVRVMPANAEPASKKRADAKQNAFEYAFDAQQMTDRIREVEYWSQTDGVAFLEVYWDPDTGPWAELPDPQDPTGVRTKHVPIGDVCTFVRRIEQVRVSSEASATIPPRYVLVREILPIGQAVALYGGSVANESDTGIPSGDMATAGSFRLGYEQAEIQQLMRGQPVATKTTIYVTPNEYLPKGLMVIAVGQTVALAGPLFPGVLPIVRWTDGSPDPAYFPVPIMETWLDSQIRINKLKSELYESIRKNKGGRVMAREGAIGAETFTAGQLSVISVRDLRPLDDVVRPFPNFSIGVDTMNALAGERKFFEDISGWNAASRGGFEGDPSGRAILATREALEQIFTGPVNAAARGMEDWTKAVFGWMRWGYTMPRNIAIQGEGRPDLGRAVSIDDFDGVERVTCDPETLMPMPTSLRSALLTQRLQNGLMSPQEFRRRDVFSWTRNMETPDDDQEARARRVSESLRQGQPLPMLWQDDEAIHQDILQRELILPDDGNPQVRQAAIQRWNQLASQHQQKMGPPPGAPMGGPPGGPPGPPSGPPAPPGPGGAPGSIPLMSPREMPFPATNPSIAATSPQLGLSDQQRAGTSFDARQPG